MSPNFALIGRLALVQESVCEKTRNHKSSLALRSAFGEGGSDKPGSIKLAPAAFNLQQTPPISINFNVTGNLR